MECDQILEGQCMNWDCDHKKCGHRCDRRIPHETE